MVLNLALRLMGRILAPSLVVAIGMGALGSARAGLIIATGDGALDNQGRQTNTDLNSYGFSPAVSVDDQTWEIAHDWFAFDLSGVGAVTSATLHIYNPGGNFPGDDSGTFNLYQASSLSFDGLVTGPILGQVQLIDVDTPDDQYVSIALHGEGLAALNAASGGIFIFGGAVSGIQETFAYNDANVATPAPYLTFTTTAVPEPSSIVMLGIAAVGGIGTYYARRRRVASA